MGLDKFVDRCEVFVVLTFCETKKILITVRWVDDMVGIASTKETNDKVTEKLAAKYKIKVNWQTEYTRGTSPATTKTTQSDSHKPTRSTRSSIWRMRILGPNMI